MIAVDTNILVHAHREESRLHKIAKERLTVLADGREPWALPVFCIGEFLRIISHPRVFDPPYTAKEAIDALRCVLLSPSLTVLLPGDAYIELLENALRTAQATGNLVFDAQIAALCQEHGVSRLLTEDRDFARFKWVKMVHLHKLTV